MRSICILICGNFGCERKYLFKKSQILKMTHVVLLYLTLNLYMFFFERFWDTGVYLKIPEASKGLILIIKKTTKTKEQSYLDGD
jgi:hypothetical protein